MICKPPMCEWDDPGMPGRWLEGVLLVLFLLFLFTGSTFKKKTSRDDGWKKYFETMYTWIQRP